MSKSAKKTEMQQLHAQLARTLNAMLSGGVTEDGKPATDDDGKPLVSASVLNVARQFLSDNDIEADADYGDPGDDNSALSELQSKANVLPFPDAGNE